MEGEFVDFDVAAFAGQGVGVGGEGVDATAIGELEDVGGEMVLFVQDDETQVLGREVEDSCPFAAVFEIEAGLEIVTGAYPDIEFGFLESDFHDGVEGVCFRSTDLPGFFPDSEVVIVLVPGGLGREEPVRFGEENFASDRLR
jgi:hypothetical protein